MKRLFEEARRWIRLSSESQNGNDELANYLSALLQDRHLKVNLQQVTHSFEEASKRQYNVIGILGDSLVDRKIRTGLLLTSHLDTCGPGMEEHWTQAEHSPFQAVQRDGSIFGLGTAQGKLDFLCKLFAVEKFREKKIKMPIYLVGTCGAELGGFGARYLIKSFALNPKYVLSGFPTQMQVALSSGVQQVFKAQIGFQLIERDARGFNRRALLFVKGRGGHAAVPELATNAVELQMSFIERAILEGFELRFSQIHGGDLTRRVPDNAFAEIQLMSHQLEDFKRFFREYAERSRLERQLTMELGGIGETGMKFIPEEVMAAVQDLVKVYRQHRQEGQRDGHKSSLTQVKNGNGKIELSFDLYSETPEGASKAELSLKQYFTSTMAKYPTLNFNSFKERSTPRLNLSEQNEWSKILGELGAPSEVPLAQSPILFSYDAGYFFEAGFPTAVVGPGAFVGNCHSPDEHCSIADLERAIVFYTNVIERVCL